MSITKQTIAIIGAGGSMGSAIAKSISGDNYRLLLFSNDISKVQSLAEEIRQAGSSSDIDERDCKHDACWEADIIILAVSYSMQKEVTEQIKDVATQKIVISTANPTNEVLGQLETSSETSAAEELQKLLPNSKIVKVFNTDFTQWTNQDDVFIAGKDEEALKTVSELVETAGFNPVVSSDLSVSRTLENRKTLHN